MRFLARILHGFRDRLVPGCCGHGWRDLGRHLAFAHGETVVADLGALPCSDCGAPSIGWAYDVMGDGQAINGRSVCAEHLAGVAA